ncbi:ABC transporter ATP-binding protein [Pararhodobacter sp. SW119]|uniref:ABC transporter ATP-binding protein n=1 Tax=Pararhodobacter sp. SW119 TaxID=2780075 RepID=UPI001ADF504C|nr:ABC transporter ATP-binding protein [Pararhodobacter sp. SW119]
MSARLEIRDLQKRFGALAVTDGISLDIAPGELHAVIGPNGAGKTTLVSQLSGQLRPDAGQVVYDGQDITHLDMAGRVRRGMARSFQITTILHGFTVLQNVALAVQARSGSSFRFFGRADAEAGLNDAAMVFLRQVGLADRAQDIARNLSHGEHRQLEFAIALATAPRLLLLDEPFAGTGREEAAQLLDLMQQIKGTQTILLVEHDMNAVFALADRVSVLVYGQIIATGTPDEIRANAEVRGAYLGEEETTASGAAGC